MLCCDKCPRVLHLKCSNLMSEPEGDEWNCPTCRVRFLNHACSISTLLIIQLGNCKEVKANTTAQYKRIIVTSNQKNDVSWSKHQPTVILMLQLHLFALL